MEFLVVSRYTFQDVRLRGDRKSSLVSTGFFYILGFCYVFSLGGISAEFFLFKFQLSFYWTYRLTLPETSMTIENQPFDDVSPINGHDKLSA